MQFLPDRMQITSRRKHLSPAACVSLRSAVARPDQQRAVYAVRSDSISGGVSLPSRKGKHK